MTWAKIDDAILDNSKIARVGPIGFALHVAAITYCARNLTDGFVPFGHAHRILATQWTVEEDEKDPLVWTLAMISGMRGDDGAHVIEHVIELLLSANLWSVVPHGYQIHDYLEYNPSRAQVLADREATRNRVQRHRNGVSNAVTTPAETPTPVPVTRTRYPVKSPNGESSSRRKRESDETITLEMFVDAWNRRCDPLPRLRKVPAGEPKLRLIRQAIAYFDGDLDLLMAAMDRASCDKHYQESGYGFEAFCRHVERWGEAPITPPQPEPYRANPPPIYSIERSWTDGDIAKAVAEVSAKMKP